MSVERPNPVVASYPISCEGVSGLSVAPLINKPAQISFTVFRDGKTNIGCAYLDAVTGICRAVSDQSKRVQCVQLKPLPEILSKPNAENSDRVLNIESAIARELRPVVKVPAIGVLPPLPASIDWASNLSRMDLATPREGDVDLDITVGDFIKAWMGKLGITQSDLVIMTGIKKSTMSRLINNQQFQTSNRDTALLVHALGLTTGHLQLRILPKTNDALAPEK